MNADFKSFELSFQSEIEIMQEIQKNKPQSLRFDQLPIQMQKVWVRCRQYGIKYKNMPKPDTGKFALDTQVLACYAHHNNLIPAMPVDAEILEGLKAAYETDVKMLHKAQINYTSWNVQQHNDSIIISQYTEWRYAYEYWDAEDKCFNRRGGKKYVCDGSVAIKMSDLHQVLDFWSEKLGVKLKATNIKHKLSSHGYNKYADVQIMWDSAA